jgi:hypothetical protein
MCQRWHKLGQIYEPPATNRHPKLLSHAANPLPLLLEGDVYRVFFSGRDAHKRSSVGAFDFDIVRRRVLAAHSEPFFEHGPEGSFYADGVSIGNCYEAGDRRYMLFMGWQSPPNGHWRGDVGRLLVTNDLRLQLDSATPFMGADDIDRVSLSYPWVEGDERIGYRMWYGSTLDWDGGNGEMVHVINHASSRDGHAWKRHGLAIPYALGQAQAFSRPTVLRHGDGMHEMWFSYRSGNGQTYRIGHASSADGQAWRLYAPYAGIDVSPGGWDSEMIAYPFVLKHKGQLYMFYNGNGFGKTGIGLAIWPAMQAEPA